MCRLNASHRPVFMLGPSNALNELDGISWLPVAYSVAYYVICFICSSHDTVHSHSIRKDQILCVFPNSSYSIWKKPDSMCSWWIKEIIYFLLYIFIFITISNYLNWTWAFASFHMRHPNFCCSLQISASRMPEWTSSVQILPLWLKIIRHPVESGIFKHKCVP